MNKEIKEMLDNMKEISSFEYTTDWFELNYEDTKILLDYITNLQEEIERQSKAQVILDDMLVNYKQENERLKFQLENQQIITSKYRMRRNIYKSRCEKAIEYINTFRNDIRGLDEVVLLNILQNGSDSQ